jgi:hypothetical protein
VDLLIPSSKSTKHVRQIPVPTPGSSLAEKTPEKRPPEEEGEEGPRKRRKIYPATVFAPEGGALSVELVGIFVRFCFPIAFS